MNRVAAWRRHRDAATTRFPTGADTTMTDTDGKAEVDAFMQALDHPHKPAIEALRRIMLDTDPAIREGIKWNAPSFRTGEWFGTTHLRAKPGIALILHFGAKVRSAPTYAIDDPAHLLEWLGKDRAMIRFTDAAAVDAGRAALERILGQWIRHVPTA
jgi:hypothetical protein